MGSREEHYTIETQYIFILENKDLYFRKYILIVLILPYYSLGKIFFKKGSLGFKFFVILNALWIGFLIIATLIGVVTCVV